MACTHSHTCGLPMPIPQVLAHLPTQTLTVTHTHMQSLLHLYARARAHTHTHCPGHTSIPSLHRTGTPTLTPTPPHSCTHTHTHTHAIAQECSRMLTVLNLSTTSQVRAGLEKPRFTRGWVGPLTFAPGQPQHPPHLPVLPSSIFGLPVGAPDSQALRDGKQPVGTMKERMFTPGLPQGQEWSVLPHPPPAEGDPEERSKEGRAWSTGLQTAAPPPEIPRPHPPESP